jgi:hypothetical protein
MSRRSQIGLIGISGIVVTESGLADRSLREPSRPDFFGFPDWISAVFRTRRRDLSKHWTRRFGVRQTTHLATHRRRGDTNAEMRYAVD